MVGSIGTAKEYGYQENTFFSRKERKNEGFMFVEMMMSVAN